MHLDVVSQILRLEVCLLGFALVSQSRQIFLRFAPRWVGGQVEMIHLCARPLYIFLNFVPYLLIFEEGVPNAALGSGQRMIHYLLLFLRVFQLRLHYQLLLETFISLIVLVKGALPFGWLWREVAQDDPPKYRPEALQSVWNPGKGLLL